MSVSVSLPWKGDFSVDDRGRIAIADDDLTYKQRIVRRLLTTPRVVDARTGRPVAPPDYIAKPTFGAGLRRLVGRTGSPDDVRRIVTEQVMLDSETSHSVRPTVDVIGPDVSGTVIISIVCVRSPNRTVQFGFRIGGVI